MTTKKFRIDDVLSITTGALVSERHMEGVYDIMGHIVGDNGISTIGLSTNAEAAKNFLHETLPWTKEVHFPELSKDMTKEERSAACKKFVDDTAKEYGEYHEVGQMRERPEVSLLADIAHVAKIKGGAGKGIV